MAEQQSQITPPPELVQQWLDDGDDMPCSVGGLLAYVATQAARWGADQELEAMLAELKALHLPDGYGNRLRDARRPNQADAALEALNEMDKPLGEVTGRRCATIRTALERLKELEANK